jgi:8-oxo-dGTP diphosphatase
MIIKVVAVLIEKNDKALIAKRSTGDHNVLSKWEFPGEKVEPEEDELHAIERETKEEFN